MTGFPSLSEIALGWLLFPVYVHQGLAVRRRTQRMIPPPNRGEYHFPGGGGAGRDGTARDEHASVARASVGGDKAIRAEGETSARAAGDADGGVGGGGETLRLLVIGDSSAAGVGVERIEDCMAFQLPEALAERTGKPVSVRIAGMNGATAEQIRDFVAPNVEERDFHYVALNVGVNDAKNFHSRRRFRRCFGTLLYALRTRFPQASIIWSGILDMERVPALPRPLNRILGTRSRLLNAQGKALCRERGALAPDLDWKPIPENFSGDGFHAGEKGYREWAELLADFIEGLEKDSPINGLHS